MGGGGGPMEVVTFELGLEERWDFTGQTWGWAGFRLCKFFGVKAGECGANLRSRENGGAAHEAGQITLPQICSSSLSASPPGVLSSG